MTLFLICNFNLIFTCETSMPRYLPFPSFTFRTHKPPLPSKISSFFEAFFNIFPSLSVFSQTLEEMDSATGDLIEE